MLAATVLVVVLLQLLGSTALAANPQLVLNPTQGEKNATFSASYTWSDCGTVKQTTVQLWWDSYPELGGGVQVGKATLDAKCSANFPSISPPPGANSDGDHPLYAYIDDGTGAVKTSLASATFTIFTPAPTPKPTDSPSPTPTTPPGATPPTGTPPTAPPGAPAITPPAATAGPPVSPSGPIPQAQVPGAIANQAHDCAVGANWDFELGSLACWTPTGDAFLPVGDCPVQPVSGDAVPAQRILINGQTPGALGGDYWHTPYPIGHRGQFWIGTFEAVPGGCGGTRGESPTGTLSRELDIRRPFIDFLVGGGNDINREKVQLEVLNPDSTWQVQRLATGRNSELLRREVWDVHDIVGRHARVTIVDNSSRPWGHINVDDFKFLDSDPRPGLMSLNVGGYGLYRDPDFPVWGFADLHSHPAANLGFGGHLIYGASDGPESVALSASGDADAHGAAGVGGGVTGNFQLSLIEGGLGHLNGGYPTYDGWPNYKTLVHQQMYIDWMHRSYLGGQRLMVALAVNNELLAQEFGDFHPYDDRTSYSRQLRAMKDLVSRHSDWMEIARTPADARRIIAQNKMVIIQGIEVPSFNDCKVAGDCTTDSVSTELQRVYDEYDVRHVIPIHIANNQFGGSSIYVDSFSIYNRFQNNAYFEVQDGSADGIDFRLGEQEGLQVTWYRTPVRLTFHTHLHGIPGPPLPGAYYAPPINYDTILRQAGTFGFCEPSHACHGMENALGLTGLGSYFINRMMDHHMMIDVDHEGELSSRAVLGIAESRHYSGIAAGHMNFRDLALRRDETGDTSKLPHESMKSDEAVRRIAALGGVVAAIAHEGDNRQYPGSAVPQDCSGSSKSWVQAYLKAVDMMGGRGVGIGVEGNGLAGEPNPRFGTFACEATRGANTDHDHQRLALRPGQIAAQTNGVRYASPPIDYRGYRFAQAADNAYNLEQRDIWEAMAIYFTGTSPDTFEGPVFYSRTAVQTEKIRNLAKGFYCREQDAPFAELWSTSYEERRAACAVRGGPAPSPSEFGHEEISRLYGVIQPLWQRWQTMENGDNVPLQRQVAGRRDFDINVDGLAQYGMVPDFIQDVRNVGVTHQQLQPFFNSAEAYIKAWEGTYRTP